MDITEKFIKHDRARLERQTANLPTADIAIIHDVATQLYNRLNVVSATAANVHIQLEGMTQDVRWGLSTLLRNLTTNDVAVARSTQNTAIDGAMRLLLVEARDTKLAHNTAAIFAYGEPSQKICQSISHCRAGLSETTTAPLRERMTYTQGYAPRLHDQLMTGAQLSEAAHNPASGRDVLGFADNMGELLEKETITVYRAMLPHLHIPHSPENTTRGDAALTPNDLRDVRECLHAATLAATTYSEHQMDCIQADRSYSAPLHMEIMHHTAASLGQALALRYLRSRFPLLWERIDNTEQESFQQHLKRKTQNILLIIQEVLSTKQRCTEVNRNTAQQPLPPLHAMASANAENIANGLRHCLSTLYGMTMIAERIQIPRAVHHASIMNLPSTPMPDFSVQYIMQNAKKSTSDQEFVDIFSLAQQPGITRHALVTVQAYSPLGEHSAQLTLHHPAGRLCPARSCFVPLHVILGNEDQLTILAEFLHRQAAHQIDAFSAGMDEVMDAKHLAPSHANTLGAIRLIVSQQKKYSGGFFLARRCDAEQLAPQQKHFEISDFMREQLLKWQVPIPDDGVVIRWNEWDDDGDDGDEPKPQDPRPTPKKKRRSKVV